MSSPSKSSCAVSKRLTALLKNVVIKSIAVIISERLLNSAVKIILNIAIKVIIIENSSVTILLKASSSAPVGTSSSTASIISLYTSTLFS